MKFIFENMGELNERVVFEDGTICEVSIDNDGYGDAYFMYRGVKFTLESDVEKDLSYTFNQKYVNMTEEDLYIVWTYNGGYKVSCEGLFDTFDEAQDSLYKALESYLDGSDDIESDTEIFMFNSRIEEVL